VHVLMCRKENWWEVAEFREKPFDVIIDCAQGQTAWQLARKHKVLKGGRLGGRFVAVVQNECVSLSFSLSHLPVEKADGARSLRSWCS
jgi:hypothetical protein